MKLPHEFTVATFYQPEDGAPTRSLIRTYTLWYSKGWPGCVEYTIVAHTAKEARRKAVDQRLAHELSARTATAKDGDR